VPHPMLGEGAARLPGSGPLLRFVRPAVGLVTRVRPKPTAGLCRERQQALAHHEAARQSRERMDFREYALGRARL